MSPPILTRTLYTTSYVFESLAVLAETRETTPDALATEMLGKLLEKEHDLTWLINRTRTDRKKRSEEYAALVKDKDQLP